MKLSEEKKKLMGGLALQVQADMEKQYVAMLPMIEAAQREAERVSEVFLNSGAFKAIELSEKMQEAFESVQRILPQPIHESRVRNFGFLEPLTVIEPEEEIVEVRRMAVEEKDGEIIINKKAANFTNKKSLEYLLLLALTRLSDVHGVCTYEAIERFLVSNGKKRIKDQKRSVKRIHNTKEQLLRNKSRKNIQLPKTNPEGLKLIDVAHGAGLIFRNFGIN